MDTIQENLGLLVEKVARITPQWLAGFFDGEGCVSIHRAHRCLSVRVDVCQKDLVILFLIAQMVGSGRIISQIDARHGNISHRVSWQGKKAIPFLNLVRDHVICKRVQVEAALEMVQYSTYVGGRLSEESFQKRIELAAKIRAANHGYRRNQQAVEKEQLT